MRKQFVLVAVLAAVLLTGCADVSPNVQQCVTVDAYGFWGGMWHGMIIWFSFIGSWFSDDIAVYAYNNTGGWYNFGFLMGIGSSASGAYKTLK